MIVMIKNGRINTGFKDKYYNGKFYLYLIVNEYFQKLKAVINLFTIFTNDKK